MNYIPIINITIYSMQMIVSLLMHAYNTAVGYPTREIFKSKTLIAFLSSDGIGLSSQSTNRKINAK